MDRVGNGYPGRPWTWWPGRVGSAGAASGARRRGMGAKGIPEALPTPSGRQPRASQADRPRAALSNMLLLPGVMGKVTGVIAMEA